MQQLLFLSQSYYWMQKWILLLVLTVSSLGSGAATNLYQLVLHSQERGAACLDGSPTGLYIHKGAGLKSDKFMIYFDSGGFCGAGTLAETIESCYKRSSSSLGTTKNYKPEKDFTGYGLLSPVPEENPLFWDWTKVFVIYCDGSEHQGHRENPIPYKDKNLYFRGSRNTLQQFRYLDETLDFYNGDTIVMTGVSAGGMATFQWSNYLMEHTKTSKVYAVPDSGYFITAFYSPLAQQKVLKERAMNLLNLVGSVPEELPGPIQKCLLKPGIDIVDCFNAANYAEFLTAPMFLIESPIDEYSLSNIVIVRCLKNKQPPYSLENCDQASIDAIEDYRLQALEGIKKLKNGRKNVGAWSPACVQHGFSDVRTFTDPRFKVKGKMVYEALGEFLQSPDSAPWLVDEQPWPSNKGCSGLETNYNLRIQ